MNARITNDYTNEQYHALPSISKSGLDLIAKSPAHFKAGFSGINPNIARIGTAVHSCILESDKGLIVAPDMKRNSSELKAAWDKWFMENGATTAIAVRVPAIDGVEASGGFPAAEQFPEFERQTGLTVVKQSEMDEIRLMKESVMKSSIGLYEGGEVEQSILFEYMGVECRVRPDWMDTKNHVLADVKSARDASPRGFAKACANQRYHVQAAFYCTGYHAVTGHWPEFYFSPVEKIKPYASALYRLDDESMEHGIYLMNRDIQTYKDCMKSGDWYGYDNDLSLSVPAWDKPDFDIVENYDELVA